jgi:hypothetical protein
MASQKSCQASAAKASRRDIRRSARRDFQLKNRLRWSYSRGPLQSSSSSIPNPTPLGESKPTRIGCRHSQDVELKTLAYAAESARTLSVVGVKVSVDFDTERIYRHQNQRAVATSDLRDNWSLLFDPDGTSCRLEALFRRDQRIGTQRWTHARHTIDFISLF